MNRGQKAERLREERFTGLGSPPFSLYTEEQGPLAWRSPRLTLGGKVPHRLASTVVRR